jgi:hypothetical protein
MKKKEEKNWTERGGIPAQTYTDRQAFAKQNKKKRTYMICLAFL